LDLRPKLTRRERLRLPQELRFKKTPRQRRMIIKYPQRKFAVINMTVRLPKELQELNLRNALSGKKPGSKHYTYSRMTNNKLRRERRRSYRKRRQERIQAKKTPKRGKTKRRKTTRPTTTRATKRGTTSSTINKND